MVIINHKTVCAKHNQIFVGVSLVLNVVKQERYCDFVGIKWKQVEKKTCKGKFKSKESRRPIWILAIYIQKCSSNRITVVQTQVFHCPGIKKPMQRPKILTIESPMKINSLPGYLVTCRCIFSAIGKRLQIQKKTGSERLL